MVSWKGKATVFTFVLCLDGWGLVLCDDDCENYEHMKNKKWGNVAIGFAIGNVIALFIGTLILDASAEWAYFTTASAIFMFGIGLIIEEIRKLKP